MFAKRLAYPNMDSKEIIFTRNLNTDLIKLMEIANPPNFGLVIDEIVFMTHQKKFVNILARKNLKLIALVNSGESIKNLELVAGLWTKLLINGFTRKSILIGVGGGSLLDVVSFTASTYMRGMPLFLIPTTLLAMADASIGGKNGINFNGKNIIGTIYIPEKTIIDVSFIKSLPQMEIKFGMVEILKHGIIKSKGLIDLISTNNEKIIGKDMDLIEKLIYESIRIKLSIIKNDLFEKNQRRVLNLGHTFGHAIEILSNYTVPHGEAVAKGLIIAMKIGEYLYGFKHTDYIMRILNRLGLNLTLPYEPKEIMRGIRTDKKFWEGEPEIVVPLDIGNVIIIKMDWGELEDVLSKVYKDLYISSRE